MSVEIKVPRKYIEHVNGSQRSSSAGQSGTNKHRGETDKVRKEAAQKATRDNQMVMVLEGGKKIRWYRASDWYSRPENQSPEFRRNPESERNPERIRLGIRNAPIA